LALPPTTSPQFKAPDSFAPSTKRRYVADPQDIEVVKKIKLNEIELQDRNTVLRGIKNNACLRVVSSVGFLTMCCALELHLSPVDVY
jgi:hypothetical protein